MRYPYHPQILLSGTMCTHLRCAAEVCRKTPHNANYSCNPPPSHHDWATGRARRFLMIAVYQRTLLRRFLRWLGRKGCIIVIVLSTLPAPPPGMATWAIYAQKSLDTVSLPCLGYKNPSVLLTANPILPYNRG